MVATTTIRAQAYQPLSATSLLVTPAAGPAAAAVSLTEGGCTPGALVAISFQGQALGTVKVGQTGEFSTTVTVPTNAKSGPGAIIVAGPDADNRQPSLCNPASPHPTPSPQPTTASTA